MPKRDRGRDKRPLAAAKRLKAAVDNPKPTPPSKVEFHLFVTTQHKDGTYRRTLAQITSKFIADIEDMFGARDSSFTYLGLEIDETPDSTPKNWFPDIRVPHVLIRLSEKAMHNPQYALWELAHECVHLLDPWQIDIYGPLNFLEEGLCAHYQDTRVAQHWNIDPPYVEAKSLVEPFMPGLADAVKHIRTQHRVRISDINRDVLLRHCPDMGFKVAEKLCSPFDKQG